MNQNKLYGAILGDLAGQPYEFKYKGDFSEFNLHDERSTFTDDTIMTLATASVLIEDDYPQAIQFEKAYKEFGERYQGDYYGSQFKKWLKTKDRTIGNSWGNGALMRVSPIYYIPDRHYSKLSMALDTAFTSHFSHEVYKAVSRLVGYSHIMNMYDTPGYKEMEIEVEPFKKLDASAATTIDFVGLLVRKCSGTHEAIETAVKAGGDTDTNASILGELFANYKNDITEEDKKYVESKLDPFLLDVLTTFNEKYK